MIATTIQGLGLATLGLLHRRQQQKQQNQKEALRLAIRREYTNGTSRIATKDRLRCDYKLIDKYFTQWEKLELKNGIELSKEPDFGTKEGRTEIRIRVCHKTGMSNSSIAKKFNLELEEVEHIIETYLRR